MCFFNGANVFCLSITYEFEKLIEQHQIPRLFFYLNLYSSQTAGSAVSLRMSLEPELKFLNEIFNDQFLKKFTRNAQHTKTRKILMELAAFIYSENNLGYFQIHMPWKNVFEHNWLQTAKYFFSHKTAQSREENKILIIFQWYVS